MLRRRPATLQAAQVGAMLSLTFVIDNDDDKLPAAVLNVPLVTLTWLVSLLFGLRANIIRWQAAARRWQRAHRLPRQTGFYVRLQFAQILGHAWLYGLGLAH